MIPVLGVPILTAPQYLATMLESIDVPVDRIVIVDNGDLFTEIETPARTTTLMRPGYNMGVAASWNAIMKATANAPWWVIAGFDIKFAPGDLTRLEDHMTTTGGVALLGTFSCFAIDRRSLNKVGWFDENFVPAYYEDNDFDYRCRLAGVPFVGLPAGLSHEISSTLRNNHPYQRRNEYSFPANHAYFLRKWGGEPQREQYTTPFDEGGDIRSWHLDVDRLAKQSWT